MSLNQEYTVVGLPYWHSARIPSKISRCQLIHEDFVKMNISPVRAATETTLFLKLNSIVSGHGTN